MCLLLWVVTSCRYPRSLSLLERQTSFPQFFWALTYGPSLEMAKEEDDNKFVSVLLDILTRTLNTVRDIRGRLDSMEWTIIELLPQDIVGKSMNRMRSNAYCAATASCWDILYNYGTVGAMRSKAASRKQDPSAQE